MRRRFAAAVTAVLMALIVAPSQGAHAATTATRRISALGIIPFAGDVFTVGTNGSLISVDPSSTPPSAPLFSAAGSPVNPTWGQFSSVSATSVARIVTSGGVTATDVQISLTGLIPNGIYSLFYTTQTSANPVCPTEPLVALTARHPAGQVPDASSFVATTGGGAGFHALVAGNLLGAPNLLIAVIYHFDGHTYGAVPNFGESQPGCHTTFGIDALRQTLIVQT